MATSRIRQRWTRRALALLIVVNAALWAYSALSSHPSGALPHGRRTGGSAAVSP